MPRAGARHGGGVGRHHLQGRGPRQGPRGPVLPQDPGQDQQEGGAVGRPPPGRQRAAVEVGVLQGDGQPQPGASQGASARGLGPVEAVEDLGHDVGAHTHPVVTYPQGDGVGGGGHGDVDDAALGVLNGVGDQVAHDPLHAGDVHLGGGGLVAQVEVDLGPRGGDVDLDGRQDPPDHLTQVLLADPQLHPARVDPGDLQQVGQHGLEAVHLVVEQLGRAPRQGVLDLGARGVELVGGHTDGGQGGAQLVGDVGDEQALHGGQGGVALDLGLEGGGHGVEGGGQPRQLVLAADLNALRERARGQALGGQGGLAHRPQDPGGDGPDPQHGHQGEADARGNDGAGGHGDQALLGGKGVQDVDVVLAGHGQAQAGAHQDPRLLARPALRADAGGDLRGPPGQRPGGGVLHGLGDVVGDQGVHGRVRGQVVNGHRGGLAAAAAQGDADPAGPGRGAPDGGHLRLGQEGHLVGAGDGGGVQNRLGRPDPLHGVSQHGVTLVAEDRLADGDRDHPEQDGDEHGPRHQGRHGDPQDEGAPHERPQARQAGHGGPAPGLRPRRQCGSPRPGPSPRCGGAPGPAPPWSAGAGRGR